MQMIDRHQRRVNYLRLSVTDRCNLRCCYCMPPVGVTACRHDEILSYEELLRVARAAAAIGIEKIRVTGGEPLVRKGLLNFLSQLSTIPGIGEVTLTTNGVLLGEMAGLIRETGVKRINVSLDSFDPETFRRVTRGGNLQAVLDGIERSREAGLGIKLNMVVMRGVNDHEIERFAGLTLDQDLAVRFIEYMPVIRPHDWQAQVVTGEEIVTRLRCLYALEELKSTRLCGPARPFRIRNAAGSLGVITPMSDHFCHSCNRIRVTSRGFVKSCLLDQGEGDLRPFLEEGREEELCALLLNTVSIKGGHHRFLEKGSNAAAFAMAGIGG